MATTFPGALDNFPNPAGTTSMNDPTPGLDHASQHTNINDAVEALQVKIGIDNSVDTNSLDYKISKRAVMSGAVVPINIQTPLEGMILGYQAGELRLLSGISGLDDGVVPNVAGSSLSFPGPALTYAEANSQLEEDALFAAGYKVVLRLDLGTTTTTTAGPTTTTTTTTTTAAPIDITPVLLMHFDNNATDSSGTGKVATGVGTPAFSSANYKFGTHSHAGSAGTYYTIDDHADFDLSSGDWALSCWFKLSLFTGTTFQQVIASKGNGLNNNWYLMFDSTTGNQGFISFTTTTNGAQINVQSGIANTNWHHIELNSVSGVITLYVDGVSLGSTVTTPINGAGPLVIGGWVYNLNNYSFLGNLDEFVIVKGSYLHNSNFTPPTVPYV